MKRSPFPRSRRDARRRGMTLVELLVVVSIIALLMGMLLPAVNGARESARQTECQNNLHQFGVGLMGHDQRFHRLCSGAFDWDRDGAITEVGWVADLVNTGNPVGKMRCRSNPAQVSDVINQALLLDFTDTCSCTSDERLGTPPQTLPDGTAYVNASRFILTGNAGGPLAAADRRTAVEKRIVEKFYNTNYMASWLLVRGGVRVDANGNLVANTGCTGSLSNRPSTIGPLSLAVLDSGNTASSIVPLLGCGAVGPRPLAENVGSFDAGAPTVGIPRPDASGKVQGFTAGPRNNDLTIPSFTPVVPPSTAWWGVWNATVQDYRGFAPVHRGVCNVLYADGGVRALTDLNGDGLLNNGFPASTTSGFADATLEAGPEDIFSGWSLRAKR